MRINHLAWTHVAWTLWALAPVAGLAYHFGPGQALGRREQAAALLAEAMTEQARAEALHAAASEKNLAATRARSAALASNSPEDAARAQAASAEEDRAYKVSEAAWRSVADALGRAQELLLDDRTLLPHRVRLMKDRALVRSGQVGAGTTDLESLLGAIPGGDAEGAALARQVREELGAGYYYGARLQRAAGRPAEEWRRLSGLARQHYRHLSSTDDPGSASARDAQLNLERVLNLEQSRMEDLQARPLPDKAPRSVCDGDCWKKGSSKSRSLGKNNDGRELNRGAGEDPEIDGGW